MTRVDSAVPAGGALTPAGVTVVRTQTAEADALVRNLIATAVTAMSARCQTVFWSSSRCARDGRLGAGRKAMSEWSQRPCSWREGFA